MVKLVFKLFLSTILMSNVLILHNIKCGGITLKHILISNKINYNITKINNNFVSNKNNEYKMIVSTIRNPYLYYISAVFYNGKSRGKISNISKEYFSSIRALPRNEFFKLYVKGILTGKIILNKENIGKKRNDVSKMMRIFNIGFLTARSIALFYNNERKYLMDITLNNDINILKLEDLQSEINKLNLDINYDGFVINKSRLEKNIGKLNLKDFYDQELIDLIYEKDKFIFEKFKYDKLILD